MKRLIFLSLLCLVAMVGCSNKTQGQIYAEAREDCKSHGAKYFVLQISDQRTGVVGYWCSGNSQEAQ